MKIRIRIIHKLLEKEAKLIAWCLRNGGELKKPLPPNPKLDPIEGCECGCNKKEKDND